MNHYVAEYNRYYSLLKRSLEQIQDDEFFKVLAPSTNSIAIILKHLAGNLRSRFSDFLTTDGEKPWRNRDSEFEPGGLSRKEIEDSFEDSWKILKENVWRLKAEDLEKTITIRGVEQSVEEALLRSVAHMAYHVGEILFIARYFRAESWEYLSIAPGKTNEYNRKPDKEKIILD